MYNYDLFSCTVCTMLHQPWVKECRTNNLPLGIAFCPHFLCVWTFGEWFFSFGAVIKTEFWRAESNIGSCLSLTLLLSSHIVRKEKLRLKILISVPLVEGINWHPSIIYRLNTTTLMVPWNSCSLVFLVLQEMAGGPFNLPCNFWHCWHLSTSTGKNNWNLALQYA